jgi:hypothetical protein
MRAMIGTHKGLFTLTHDGAGWDIADAEFLGEAVPSGVVAADGTAYAALGTGHWGAHLWRRDPGATAWTEVGVPEYPLRPDGCTDVSPMSQAPWPWALELMWTLEAGHPSRPDELWCGTIPGGLFQSTDRGQTWSINRPLWDAPERPQWFGGGYDWPGIHTISVDPRDADTMLIAISSGGTWVTTDAGQTWHNSTGMRNEYMPPGEEYGPIVQDPHRVSRCLAAPDVVWNQHHNGCFRSIDGGRTWTEIEERPPSRFGFAVVAHPTDQNTAWFVPAVKDEMRIPVDGRLVVTRTTDGGETFQSFGAGLPDAHAYDLMYRHGLDVDATGRHLLMGSTTGSLWASGDGGERWSTVSANLPPIYFVRILD